MPQRPTSILTTLAVSLLALTLIAPWALGQAPFQPSHENRYPFTNWSTFAPPKWSKFTPPLTMIPPQRVFKDLGGCETVLQNGFDWQ